MAFVLKDRVREYTDTNGTGAIIVRGALEGYETFASVLATGDTTLVCVEDGAGNWQTFLATWDESAGSLTRTTAYESSDGDGQNVSFSGENQKVWINYPAQHYTNPTPETINIGTGLDAYSTSTGPRLFIGSAAVRATIDENTTVYMRPSTAYSNTHHSALFVGGIYSGTVDTAPAGIYAFQGTDSIAGGNTFFLVQQEIGAGATGGRTTLSSRLIYTTATTAGASTNYQVSQGAITRIMATLGGIPGSASGNVFAGNDITTLGDDSGGTVFSLIGRETDTTISATAGAQYHIGISSILHYDQGNEGTTKHETRGHLQDAAFNVGTADNQYSTVGWRIGLSLGSPVGWALDDDSRVIAPEAVGADFVATSRDLTLADVIDMTDVDLKRSLVISKDAAIDLDGNIGGQVTGGVTVQARDGVYAKTAVVASITPLQPDGGGLYSASGAPTVVIDAPPGSGTTATATIATHGAQEINTMTAGGSGYAVDQILTQTGGTFTTAAQVRVTRVDGTGKIREMIVETAGSYSVLPSGEQTFTGGTGTLMTASLLYTALTFTVSGAGTNYPQYPAPVARFTGAGVFRPPVLVVAMTATQVPLSLNPGSSVVISTQTPASAAASGTAGTIAWDSSYIYVCTAANTWKRVAIATW